MIHGSSVKHDLRDTARSLVAAGKGILAADESDGTIERRFDSIGVESTSRTVALTGSSSSAPRC
jgi:fructose-bisphosphate aldolase class 1